MLKQTLLVLLLCSLVACDRATPTLTLAPLSPNSTQPLRTSPPPANATAVATQPFPTAPKPAVPPPNGKTFSDPALGLSFIYPPDWEILPRAADAPPGVTLHAPPLGTGPEPFIFTISVDVQPATEDSAKTIVDEQLAQVPSDLQGGIRRRTLTVGGTPAEEVIGLPSQAGAIETFVLHNGQAYLVILEPYDETNQSLAPYLSQARVAYDGVLASYAFLK